MRAIAFTTSTAETDLLRRIRAEFDEMPGMHLTFEQTARLMGIDKTACEAALDALTMSGFLTKSGMMYSRAADGPVTWPTGEAGRLARSA